MKNDPPILSKSKYLSGLQCSRLLWHYFNAKHEIPPVDTGTQAIFDQGHQVGALAKTLYPDGIEVAEGEYDYYIVDEESGKLIEKRVPLFEPGFIYRNTFARADILHPIGRKGWEIIEVKSTTSVKEVNIHDLALQWYVYEGAGLKIKRCGILHLDNSYVRKGAIKPSKLFKLQDTTRDVKKLVPGVEKKARSMSRVIGESSAPVVPIGLHCGDPYDCPLTEKCFAFLPDHNPLTLYRLSPAKAFGMIHDGRMDLRNLDDKIDFSDRQQIQIKSLRSRRAHSNPEAIREFLETLEYPVYFLDFETINPAIPLFDGTCPFQQVPFQFSLHVQESPGARPVHTGFLADGRDDPRPAFLKQLRAVLGSKGSIVTYNESFEKNVLRRAAEAFPEFRTWEGRLEKRMIDLLAPFRAFSYYHYNQFGSASIKAVLPVLTGRSYEGMAISDGGQASREFLRVTFADGIAEEEKKTVRRTLEEYCALDTLAMVEIVEKLREMV